MDRGRSLRHSFAIVLGLVMLVVQWYALFAIEDSLIYKLEQAAGLLGGLTAFGVALAFARGRREEFRLGWAFLGAIAATAGLYALAPAIQGAKPDVPLVAVSLGAGIGYGLPYLLLAYGWKGSEGKG